MPTLNDLERSGEAIFTTVGSLQEQLRGIPNARSTFSVENGMEYFTNAELSKKLARAAKKSPSFKGGNSSQHTEGLAHILGKCIKNLEDCEGVISKARQRQSWSPNLEEEISVNWRMFCMHLHDASTMLEVTELDIFMLMGKPEVSTNKEHDADTQSVSTATDLSWHSKGSFIRLFQSKNQHSKRNKLSKQQNGDPQTQAPGLSTQHLPDNADAVSDPGLSRTKKDPRYLNPSVRSSSPPPRYSDVGMAPSFKGGSQRSQEAKPFQPALSQDPQGPLSRFSKRFDVVPPAQPGAQTFVAEHIHMYHGCPPTQYLGSTQPGAPQIAAWQPLWQPPPQPPGPPLLAPPGPAYKSSAYSLRETLATEFLDLIKPDATCLHGVRHYKNHATCGWGCCWQRGCFGRW